MVSALLASSHAVVELVHRPILNRKGEHVENAGMAGHGQEPFGDQVLVIGGDHAVREHETVMDEGGDLARHELVAVFRQDDVGLGERLADGAQHDLQVLFGHPLAGKDPGDGLEIVLARVAHPLVAFLPLGQQFVQQGKPSGQARDAYGCVQQLRVLGRSVQREQGVLGGIVPEAGLLQRQGGIRVRWESESSMAWAYGACIVAMSCSRQATSPSRTRPDTASVFSSDWAAFLYFAGFTP